MRGALPTFTNKQHKKYIIFFYRGCNDCKIIHKPGYSYPAIPHVYNVVFSYFGIQRRSSHLEQQRTTKKTKKINFVKSKKKKNLFENPSGIIGEIFIRGAIEACDKTFSRRYMVKILHIIPKGKNHLKKYLNK